MAENTDITLGDHLVKSHAVVPMFHYYVITIADNMAAQNDSIKVIDVPAGQVVTGLIWNISATLGASCTLQARVGTSAISAASSAGSADTEVQTAYVAPSTSEAPLNFLVGGAAITEPATLTVGFYLAPAQSKALA